MKKMKRILCLVLALGLVFALCACGNPDPAAPTDEGNADAQQTASAAPENGEKVVPLTVISMSGRLSEVLANIRLSDKTRVFENYGGPYKVLLKGMEIL